MKRWMWLLPVLLAAVAYAPAPWGDLVWDDYFIAQQVPAFRSLDDLLLPPEGIPGWTYAYYRPAVVLSYMLDASLYGPVSTIGPHVSNVLYHMATTFFVWLLIRRLLNSFAAATLAATLSAAIFAVHPIHTESVHWIAGRSDLLATLFVVPSAILALRWRDGGPVWTVLVAGFMFLLALMSKEVAVAALVIVPATLVLARSPVTKAVAGMAPTDQTVIRARGTAVTWVTFAGVYLCCTALYVYFRDSADPGSDASVLGLSLGKSAWNLIRAGAYYLVKVVMPWPQSNVVSWDMLPGFAGAAIIVLFAGALGAVAIGWWRKCRDGIPLLAICWFAAALAPSLVVAVGNVMEAGVMQPAAKLPVAERYLYLPSVALAIIFGRLIVAAVTAKWRRIGVWAGAAIIGTYGVAAIDRGLTWNSNIRLWSDTTGKVMTKGAPWNELGRSYLDIGDDEQAQQAFEHALTLESSVTDRATMYHNLGNIHLKRSELEAAEVAFRNALEIKADIAESHYGMGLVHTMRIGNLYKDGGSRESLDRHVGLATRHFAAAAKIDPDFHLVWLLSAQVKTDYGRVLEREGDRIRAVAAYRAARSEIDAVLKRIPESELRQYTLRWQEQIHVNVAGLGAEIDAGLQRLGD